MALTLQNLRTAGPGSEPSALLPGQIAFNIRDKIMFVGDGTDVKTRFDGTSSIGVPGEGWYSMPMDFSQFSTNFIVNPEVYGDIPTDGQVLTWDQALGHTIWTNGGSTSNLVYTTTNAAVAAAPGITLTIKINNAIGVVSPDPNDWVVVSGLPGDIYQGVYFFSGATWNKAANYAFPVAAQVPYSNTASGLTANDVQEGIDELDVLVTAAQASANSAFAAAGIAQDAADAAQTDATQALTDAATAQATADAALPRAGGTMTGPLIAQEVTTTTLNTDQINVASGYGISFSTGALGTIFGISGTVSSTSTTTAASSAGLKTAYDIAASALQRAGGTMTGAITFVAGQLFPISGINIATVGQLGVVQVGNYLNINVAGVLNVDVSTTTQAGVVQLNDTLTSSLTTQALTARAGADLQGQINSLTLASNVTLAGSLNADTGLVDSVTTLGTAAGFVAGDPLPNAAVGNEDYYVLVTTGGSYDPPGGGGPYAAENGDWFLSTGTAWQYLGVGARPQSATYNTAGIVQLADTAVTYTGTSDTEAITPNSLQDKISDSVALADPKFIASSNAVKTAYDLANAALPLTGGTLTGTLNTLNVCLGTGNNISFNGGASGTIRGISDATGNTNDDIAASSTAVKSAYDLANSALQRAGGTMTGTITFEAGQTFPIAGIQDATTGQKGVVQIGTNIQVSSGTISVNTATTGQLGLVQVGTNVQVSSGTISVDTATTTQLGLVQAGTNVQISSGTISILNSSTTQSGVVQLNDTAASTSTTQALTANQGYLLQQQINALSTSNNITFAGTFDSANSQMVTVTAEGAAVGFIVGNPLPAASATVAEFFVIVSVAGTTTPPGGVPTVTNVGDWFLASASSWTYIAAGYVAPAASTTTPGVVELATDAETQTGTDSTRAVVPAGLQSKISDSVSTASGTTIASSAAVKTAYDLANAAVPKSCYTALGALAVGTAASTVGTLAIGTNGQSLVVDTACATGLKWGLSLAGYTCTATPFNTALGALAGDSITTGTNNTAIGYNSGTAITGGLNNTFVGFDAGDGITSADNNVAVGSRALSNTGGNNNTVVGYCTGGGLSSGGSNTFIGGLAGYRATTLDNAVAVGYGAMGGVTTGTGQVAVGSNALCSLTSGAGNVAVGYQTLDLVTTGANNTAVGHQAGSSVSTNVSGNTLVGFQSGTAVTAGGQNTLIGNGAGSAITTGANNTILGNYTGTTALANNVVLSDGAGNRRFQANDSGAWSYNGTDFGTTGQFLTSQGSAATPAWCTISIACVPCSAYTAVGTILAGNGAGTYCSLPIGTNGQVLVPNSACAAGVQWVTCQGIAICGYTCTATPFNTALGANAGDSIITGIHNTNLGHNAGTALASGGANTFVGSCAGDSAITADNSVAVGFNALTGAVTANGTVAIGSGALASMTSGAGNVGIGYQALDTLITGGCNTAVGFQTGTNVATTVSGNTLIGYQAGLNTSSGGQNTFVGNAAGSSVTTGANNTILGNYNGIAALSGNVVLSDGAGNRRFQSNSSGAWSYDGSNFGTAGQVLKSAGTAAAPAWSSALYGAFSSSVSQTNLDTTNGNAVTLDTTASANGFSIVSGSQVTATTAGVYNIQISLQVEKTDAGTDAMEIWFKKNGANIANSNTNIELKGGGAKELFALNLVEPLTAGQYLEVWWYSADVNAQLTAIAAGTRPAIPSAIITVVPVGA